MTSLLCAHSLPANRAVHAEPEIGLEHAFVLLIWQKKHDNGKFARCSFAKTTANCFNFFLSLSFDLIRESASTVFDYWLKAIIFLDDRRKATN
jgi:hypothetical protein